MRQSLILIVAAGGLAGCAPSSFSDRPATLRYTTADNVSPADTERVAIRNYHALADGARGNMDRRSYRDSIVWREIAADDDDFHAFVRHLRTDRAAMNLSTDAGVTVLNGLGTVTGTAGEKAALAALSGGLLGIHGSFQKELFNLETMSAILARMRAARLAALVPIKLGLAKDINQYPLEQALVDLRQYANAGSLSATIEAIANDAGKVTGDANAQIDNITRDTVYRDSRGTVDGLRNRLLKLTDNQALGMAFAMERHIGERSTAMQDDLRQADPGTVRFKSGANARQFLLYWLEEESGASGDLDQWSAALDVAEKG